MTTLAGVPDVSRLPYAARLRSLAAIRRQRALLDARETALLAALAAEVPPGVDASDALDREWVREDIACALRLPPMVAHGRLADATDLTTRLPATVASMTAGDIGLRYATRLVEAIRQLPDPAAAAVERRVLPRAGSQTLAQFTAAVRRAVLTVDPRRAEKRHADAMADRRVVFRSQDDGVAELWALLPAEGAALLKARLDALAAAPPGPGDDRTLDQRRADALVDLARGAGVPGLVGAADGPSAGPTVNVTVALSTLLGLDQQPGELNGEPIPAALARRLAFDPTGTWRRLVTDPLGRLLDCGRTTYRPPASLDRLVRARDVTCRFPGCRRRAARCELDHVVAWAEGGTTDAVNLHCLCPRHHHLKHEGGWSVRCGPDGTTRWRSPSGASYTQPPEPLPVDRTLLPTGTDPPS